MLRFRRAVISGILLFSLPLFSGKRVWFTFVKAETGGWSFLFEKYSDHFSDTFSMGPFTPEPYYGMGLNLERFHINDSKSRWGLGYGMYILRFLITPQGDVVEFPEWFGVSIGATYRIKEKMFLLIKQSFGGGLYALFGAVGWGVSHTSVSFLPFSTLPLEVFLEFYSIWLTHPEWSGHDEWTSWGSHFRGGIRFSLGWQEKR